MEVEKSICKLCFQEKELLESHIIPAFVFKWLKNTSATGYMRTILEANKRIQDGKKQKLLCKDCEGIFNEYETQFSKQIFHPYVSKELSPEGIAQGNIKEFEYDSWLLKFIISIQWRILVASNKVETKLPDRFLKRLADFEENSRNYLLGKSDNTGKNESHLFFLQNLAAAEGDFPEGMSDKVVHYTLRAIDGTSVYSPNTLKMYFKLGPIAFITAIIPDKITNSEDSKIRNKGIIKTAQKLMNERVNNFIFITRPHEAFDDYHISEKQKEKIKADYLKNPDRVIDSMSIHASMGDLALKSKVK